MDGQQLKISEKFVWSLVSGCYKAEWKVCRQTYKELEYNDYERIQDKIGRNLRERLEKILSPDLVTGGKDAHTMMLVPVEESATFESRPI